MNETNPPRRLVRSRDDRFIGGVAAGIANYFNLDPVLIRVAFVISIAFGGIGVFAYLALLVLVPVDGDPADPVDRPTGAKRALVVTGTIVLGCLALASIDGGFGGWFFGIGPGPLFGILIWIAAIAGVIWLVREATRGDKATSGAFGRSPDSMTPTPPASPEEPVTTTMAPSPTQTAPTETLPLTPAGGAGGGTPGATPPGTPKGTPPPGTPPPPAPQSNSGGSQVGKVITWFAIGISSLIVFSILAVLAAWITAVAGAIPVATVIILLGGGLVFAALRGRSQLAIWMLATALVIAVPMAVISLADLRIEGHYGELIEEPTAAAEIPEDGYRLAAGAMTIDMRDYRFERGESVDLSLTSGFGLTRVIVPDNVCVSGEVEGTAGLLDVKGVEVSGAGLDRSFTSSTKEVPKVVLDADFKLGMFEVIDRTTWGEWGPPNRQADDWGSRWEDNWDDSNATAAAKQRALDACDPPQVKKPTVTEKNGQK